MTNEEIIKKAVKKAIKNGYDWADYDAIDVIEEGFKKYSNDLDWIIFPIIFSHRFAKAFWGDKEVSTNTFEESWDDGDGYIDGGNEIDLPAWEHHLCMMVLKKEPLKYLEEFLK